MSVTTEPLLLGCYSYGPENNSTKGLFSSLSANKTTESCLAACVTSGFKIALSNNSFCICSHETLTSMVNITNCRLAHVTSTGSDVSDILFNVYNTSTLFPGYCEVFDEIFFEFPRTVMYNESITRNHEFSLDFGDGYKLLDRTGNISYVSHRYLRPGYHRVMLSSQSDNGSVCHAYRDVIVQQGVVVRGMTCPPYAKTNVTVLCRMDLLSGSNMTVDLEVVNQNNTSVRQEFKLPGK